MPAVVARIVLKGALLGLALPSQALSLEQIEQRLESLERENAALKREVEVLRRQVQGSAESEPQWQQEVVTPSSGTDSIAASSGSVRLSEPGAGGRSRIKIDGFLSAGFSTNDERGGLRHSPYGFTENLDFESDAVLGLQVNFDINEDARVVTQIVANGWEQWRPEIEWAYLAYDLNKDASLRAGRMRVPLYLFSESLDVGYSYPWVRPPLTLYTTELSNYDGVDATYKLRLGSLNHRWSAYAGSFSFDEDTLETEATVKGDDVFGVNWTGYWRDWTFRLAYSHLRNTATVRADTGVVVGAPPAAAPVIGQTLVNQTEYSESIDFYSTAISYDDGNWLAILEAAQVDVGSGVLLGDEVQGVFTLGYRQGNWLPYIGYGREYYKQALPVDNRIARSRDRDYKLNILGLRYDVVPGVSAKVEWNHYYDFKGSSGPFERADAFVVGDPFDAVNIYTFLIDVVF